MGNRKLKTEEEARKCLNEHRICSYSGVFGEGERPVTYEMKFLVEQYVKGLFKELDLRDSQTVDLILDTKYGGEFSLRNTMNMPENPWLKELIKDVIAKDNVFSFFKPNKDDDKSSREDKPPQIQNEVKKG